MPREYRHIEQYEKEILKLQEQGFTQRQIGERLGFRKEQIKEFVRRKREKDRKIAAGIMQKYNLLSVVRRKKYHSKSDVSSLPKI